MHIVDCNFVLVNGTLVLCARNGGLHVFTQLTSVLLKNKVQIRQVKTMYTQYYLSLL